MCCCADACNWWGTDASQNVRSYSSWLLRLGNYRRQRARADALGDEYERALRYFANSEAVRSQRDFDDARVSKATQQIVRRLLELDNGEHYGAMVLIRVPTINPDGIELYKKLSTVCRKLGLHNRLAVLM